MAFYNLIFTCSCIASTTGTLAFGFLEVKVVQIIDNEMIMRTSFSKFVVSSRAEIGGNDPDEILNH